MRPAHWSYDTFTVFLTMFQGQRSHQDIYRPVCVRNTVNPATVFRVPVLKDWDRNTVNTSRDGNRPHQPTNERHPVIHARPTTYNGIRMRSRLEASFAERLDAVGAPWQYEPQCFASPEGQYLPDFVVDGEYVEIKPPVADLDAAHKRMHIILASEPDAVLYVVINDIAGWQRVRICKPCEGSRCTCARQQRPCDTTCGCDPAETAARAKIQLPHPECETCNKPATRIGTTGYGPTSGGALYHLCDNCDIPPTTHAMGFSVGDDVRHPRFGEGTILSIEDKPGITMVVIRFIGAGELQLPLGYSPLEKLHIREGAAAAARRQLAERTAKATR